MSILQYLKEGIPGFESNPVHERAGSDTKNLIVVDIQPLYKDNIKFSINDFANFLLAIKKNILYFYNGPDTIGSEDSPENIMMWLTEEAPQLENMDWNKVEFYDKGYSFFRDWMDAGVSDNGMKQALRYMYMNRKHDSRDIPVETWKEILPPKDFDAIGDSIADEGRTIWTPDISIGDIKNNWNNSLLCGGSLNECMKEIMIMMSTFNIGYTIVDKFTYV
jgi:hypothetical protein